MLGRSPIGTWMVSAADCTPGTARNALDDLIEERQTVRAVQAPRRIDAHRHCAARVESRIDVEQCGQAAQQQSAGDREDDDERDLRDERQTLRVHRARIGCDSGMRPQPIQHVATPQVQQRDAAKDERDGGAQAAAKAIAGHPTCRSPMRASDRIVARGSTSSAAAANTMPTIPPTPTSTALSAVV